MGVMGGAETGSLGFLPEMFEHFWIYAILPVLGKNQAFPPVSVFYMTKLNASLHFFALWAM